MPPLLNIPFGFVVVDTLHLFLRIMGLLFHQVSLKVLQVYKEMPFSYANPFEILALSGDKEGNNGSTTVMMRKLTLIYYLNIGC